MIEGAVLRVRPKLMTVLTDFIALMPILWGSAGNWLMTAASAIHFHSSVASLATYRPKLQTWRC